MGNMWNSKILVINNIMISLFIIYKNGPSGKYNKYLLDSILRYNILPTLNMLYKYLLKLNVTFTKNNYGVPLSSRITIERLKLGQKLHWTLNYEYKKVIYNFPIKTHLFDWKTEYLPLL